MKRLAGTIVVVAWMLGAGPAWAVDCEGLQEALTNAPADSTVTLDDPDGLCAGQYRMAPGGITLQGAPGAGFQKGGAETNELYSLIGESMTGTVVLRNLIFRGPASGAKNAGGLTVFGRAAFTLEDSTFSGIRYDLEGQHGGGASIFNSSSAPVRVLGNTFGVEGSGNETAGAGGGLVAVGDGLVELDGNTFTDNVANVNGGGARVWATHAVITGNTFTGNAAHGEFGGGLALTTEAVADDGQENLFLRRAPEDDTEADADIERNTFTGNHADSRGGGLFVAKNGDVNDVNESFSSGAAPTVRSDGNRMDLNKTGGGTNDESGGGAHYEGVLVQSVDDRYTRNTVPGNDGCDGPCDAEGGGLSVRTSRRTATFHGVNTVAAGNSIGSQDADAEGAGMYTGASSVVTLIHATIAGNVIAADEDGDGEGDGIGGNQGDNVALDRSIVHGNTGGGDDIEGIGTLTVDRSDVCEGTDPIAGAENICADPHLAGPTFAGGGDVHETLDSPTYDRIADLGQRNVLGDYEGDVRPILSSTRTGTPFDMGADEFGPSEYGISITDSPDPVTVGNQLTYTVTVDNAGPGPADGLTVTATLPAGAARVLASRLPSGCTGTTTVTCNVGTLAGGTSRVLAFVVRPTAPGSASATATVSGTSPDLTTDDHTASTSTTVNAVPAAAVAPAVASLPAAKTCKSRRAFRIRIRKFRKDKVVSARVRVNGKLVKVLKGGRLRAPVVLTGLPRGRFTVTITATRKSGKKISGTRRYRTCTKKQTSGRIPPL